jgi:putative membrane protein
VIRRSMVAAVIILTGTFGAAAQTTSGASVGSDEFVKKAGVSGMFEIQSSELALKASSNADVKAFARQMIKDHTKASKELKSTARASGEGKVPAALDEQHQALLSELQGKKGEAFDKAYVGEQVQAHDEAVTLFSAYSQSGDDPKLRQFASETLPTLKMHQDHAKKLESGSM